MFHLDPLAMHKLMGISPEFPLAWAQLSWYSTFQLNTPLPRPDYDQTRLTTPIEFWSELVRLIIIQFGRACQAKVSTPGFPGSDKRILLRSVQ